MAQPEDDQFDVVVIGAGYGGAPLAALRAHQGRRVALIDKTPRAGGKAQTLDRRGYRYEMFGAVGIPAVGSRFDELVDQLGIQDRVSQLVPEGHAAAICFRAPDGTWRSQRSPLRPTGDAGELTALQRTFGATDRDMELLATFYLTILSMIEDEVEALDDVGMLAFLWPFGLPTGLESQILATMNMLFAVAVDRLAASEGVLVLRQVVLGGAGRFHAGGYGQVPEACAAYVDAHGGAFVRSTRVDEIVIEDGRATGVRCGECVLKSAAVVSNAGIQPTIVKLAGAGHFPDEYVAMVEGLEPSWSIAGLRYLLDERVFDAALKPVFSDQSWLDSERFAVMEADEWPDVPLIAVDVASEFDPTLVGCDAGGRGAGTHQAVDSAFRVAELVGAELG